LNDARAKIKGIRTRPEHIPVGARDVMDIDIKVTFAKNTIKYYLLTQKISGDFNKIKSVIKEGR